MKTRSRSLLWRESPAPLGLGRKGRESMLGIASVRAGPSLYHSPLLHSPPLPSSKQATVRLSPRTSKSLQKSPLC